jgi:hypothetical protein
MRCRCSHGAPLTHAHGDFKFLSLAASGGGAPLFALVRFGVQKRRNADRAVSLLRSARPAVTGIRTWPNIP